jgi:hypothetical protein
VSPSEDKKQNKIWAWIRWFLFSEGLILLLALAGPGRLIRYRQRDSHDLLARMFIDDPCYLEAVVVNFVALHLFIGCAFLAAWVVTRARQKD